VQLAQILRARGQSTPYGRTIRHTSNEYIDYLKPVKAVRKVKVRRWTLQSRTVRDLTTWNNRVLVGQSNSSELSAIHGWTVRTWTTYRLAKNPGRSVVQGLKNTPSLPKLKSSYADGSASWLGRSAKKRQRQTGSRPLWQSRGRSSLLARTVHRPQREKFLR
jgi:hypothetical protein